jgi:imidazolonepropionase-like amidohydrolase
MNCQISRKIFILLTLLSVFIFIFDKGQSAQTVNTQLPSTAEINEKLALTNVTLIDGNGGKPQPMKTLIVSRGRITDIFTTSSKKIPSDAKIMDLSGKFVIPGLIDSHVHLMTREIPAETTVAILRLALLGGVTTVRDMGGNGAKLAKLNEDFQRGSLSSPRIYYSAVMAGRESRWFNGSYLSFASNGMALGTAPWARAITDDMDVAKIISEAKATGATAIKLYSHLSPEMVKRLIVEAHRQNLKVWSHASVTETKPSDLAAAKVDSLSHADMVAFEGSSDQKSMDLDYGKTMMSALQTVTANSKEITKLLRLMKREKVVLDETLYIVAGAAAAPDNPNLERHKKQFEFACGVTRRAKEMGVTVAAGTDALGGSSPNLHAELQLLVNKSGFTPLEAITAATLNGARAIGIEKDYGTLEPGKVADLVILSANPAEDIRNTQTIESVMQGGKLYKREQLLRTPPLAEPPLQTRIQNVENGLLSAVVIKGKKAEMTITDRMRFYKTAGVSIAVINNGKIEWAKGYGNVEAGNANLVKPDTLFQAGSISKPLAAVTALRLVEKEKLSLDENVNLKLKSWKVPENEFTKDKKVTLRGLLTHSAGLTVHGFDGYETGVNSPTLLQILDGTNAVNSPPIRVDFVPGSRERYSGGGFTVLQQLMIDTMKEPFPDLTRKAIFQKLGMTSSTFESPLPKNLTAQAASGHRADGNVISGKWHIYPEMAAASLWSTPSDLARFVIELQNSYNGKSNKILSTEMTRAMLARQNKNIANSDAGLGIFLKGKPEPFRFSHNGSTEGYSAIMVGFINNGQGAVIMTNSDEDGELISEILRSIAKEYGWNDMKTDEISTIEVNSSIYANYTGRYKFPSGLEFIITSENGRLYVARPNGWRAELLPETETTYFVMMPGAPRLTFIKNEQGKFGDIVFSRDGRDEKGQRIY